MRVKWIYLLLLFVCPIAAIGQSTLNFPRAFTPADLASTGFAVVNPGTATATVSFTLYNGTGSSIASSAQTIAGGSQMARLGTELFPSASEPGWVQINSATAGLQGFWVGGDFATFTDGADAAPVASDLVFPLVTAETEINLANTSTGTNDVTLQLFGADGSPLASATRSLRANGVLQSKPAGFFPSANLDNARYIRVQGGQGLTGTAVVKGFLVDEWGVGNAVSTSAAGNEANFPHVVSGAGGGGNYTTAVGVTNLASAAQRVTFTFTPENGGSPTSISRDIPANGSLRDTAQNIFSFPGGFQNGWVRVAGSAPLTALVAYADSVAGGLAIVPVQTAPRTGLMFAHIADLSPWLTGLALLNATNASATVSVYAITPTGTLIGGADNVATARFTMAPGTKTARLLSELVPQTQQRTNDSGFIFISSTQPLYGLELFFSRNLRVFANVAAGTSGGFTAPTPAAPLTLSSASPARLALGATLTLTGTGFSPVAENNTIIFTGASGIISRPANTATSTSLTVAVPNGAITGTVAVKVGAQTSASKVLEILATATSLLPAAVVTVNSAAATSGVDIYVPPATAALNVNLIGLGDAGGSINLSTSSADIGKGQTKVLAIGGTGLSAANGTTVSVSGDGITLGNVQFQSGFAMVNITVSASATSGPRSVSVTNSNLDMSVLSGGLIVR